MVWKNPFARLRERMRDFCVARTANVTVTFALSTIPVVGAVGAAVDYSHVNSARTAMQSAVDATALMLSKEISTLSSTQISQKATNYFSALYTRPEVTNISVTPTYTTTDGTQIVVKASGDVKASFVSLIGIQNVQIGASSTVKWGNTKLRVALALDVTGSMAADGKMTALKTAAKNLLTQLNTAAAQNGDVYVSIVPFAKDVNVGSSNYNASWIDWTDWDVANGTCSKSGYNSKSSCTSQGTCSVSGNSSQSSCNSAGTCSISTNYNKSDCENDGVCSKSQFDTQTKCTNHAGQWTPGIWTLATWTPATWTPKNHNTWTGCVMDRGDTGAPSSGNYDTNVSPPITGTPATQWPAEQYSDCSSVSVMQLNYDWTAMTTAINNLNPEGNTNQGIGLALAWMSLTGGGPFTVPAKQANYKYNEVIVLMSDGLNTQNRWYSNATSIDARQKITCDNAKAAGMTIYTIHVNTGGDPMSTLLKDCASDASKFFHLTSATQMVDAFKQIGTQLSNLRVAK